MHVVLNGIEILGCRVDGWEETHEDRDCLRLGIFLWHRDEHLVAIQSCEL
jgi:hypothetical protein